MAGKQLTALKPFDAGNATGTITLARKGTLVYDASYGPQF